MEKKHPHFFFWAFSRAWRYFSKALLLAAVNDRKIDLLERTIECLTEMISISIRAHLVPKEKLSKIYYTRYA